jgi:hypothetical protein
MGLKLLNCSQLSGGFVSLMGISPQTTAALLRKVFPCQGMIQQ